MNYIKRPFKVSFLIFCLICFLAACSKEITQPATSDSDIYDTTSIETLAPVTIPATTVPETTVQEESVQYEIISSKAFEYPSHDEYKMNVLVEFVNTGTCNMYLPEIGSTYDLEDSDGNLISAQNPIYAMPTVLRPGETGYLCIMERYEQSKGSDLIVVPRILTKPATLECVRYEITDTQCVMGDFGIKVLGKVTNTGTETYEQNYIACFLYDENGNLLRNELAGVEYLAPGETTGFETYGLGIPGETVESVAKIVCYAYPVLTQD